MSTRYFVDLFAGCGGLSLGLEQAGFIPALVNEINIDAMGTYLRNREIYHPLLRSKYHIADVKELVLDPLMMGDLFDGFRRDYGIDLAAGQLDLVVGGPPCQGFSGIGHRRSFSVEKRQMPSNHLYQDMAYVISRLRPKIFLFENVRGLLTARWSATGSKGEVWADVLSAFTTLEEYEVRWSLVYAKDYGVPQNRPRVLLVGVRRDLNLCISGSETSDDAIEAGLLPGRCGQAPDLCELLDDLVDPNYIAGGKTVRYLSEPLNLTQEMLRTRPDGSIIKRGDLLSEQQYSSHSPRVQQKFIAMLASGGVIPEEMRTKKFSQRLLPPRWGEVGPTITATSMPDDYVHYLQPRVLTVREWARLQMFPDWYEFEGKRTTGGIRRAGNPRDGIHERELPKYTQIGNAVPVALARCIGEQFMSLLKDC